MSNLPDSPPRSRSERRREDTRRRLMKATYEIIAQRGTEGLVIQDITEAADVGYGSFYNHFTSKDAIVAAVIDAARERAIEIHERLPHLMSDRVEAFAAEVRLCLYQSKTDKTWGWFIIRTVLSGQGPRAGIAVRLRKMLSAGIEEGVFKSDDAEMAYHTVAGLLLLGTLKLVSSDMPDDFLDRLVSTCLKSLSVPLSKIESVMTKPLPDLNLPPFLEAAV